MCIENNKKKKLYYLTNIAPKKNGISASSKVFDQIKIFEENKFNVQVMYPHSVKRKIKNLIFRKKERELKDIESNAYIYIRYYMCNFTLIRQLNVLKKNKKNVKVAIEIPTFPYDGEWKSRNLKEWLKNAPKIYKDKITRKKLFKYIDKIITFSDDKKIWGIDTINISNSVNLNKIKPRVPNTKENNNINLIAVASIRFWHGYDRIISGLGEYYHNAEHPRDIKLFIIGDGEKRVIKQYKNLIRKYNLENRVILTGPKTGDELNMYYDQADIGLDTMGRYRTQVTYNSTLKGKEYLAKGLPIISGVSTELDKMTDFKYYLRVPANDGPIDIAQIIKFYDNIYSSKTPLEVTTYIRQFCEQNFEFKKCFKKVIDWYNEEENEIEK